MEKINIFWFRRDLRLEDNCGLYHALKSGLPVLPIFIFDRNILDKLEDKRDARVNFIHDAVQKLQDELKNLRSSILTYYNTPEEVFSELFTEYKVNTVFANHDFEPYAIERDEKIKVLSNQNGIEFKSYKDHVIFEKGEVIKDNGSPYTVFTPYSNKWKEKLSDFYLSTYPSSAYSANFVRQPVRELPSLASMNFEVPDNIFPPKLIDNSVLKNYGLQRDFPGQDGTSRLGIHLRFGTISIRALASLAKEMNPTFLNELIWRDFYQAILWHFPRVGAGRSFKPAYDNIQWRNNEEEFAVWCKGKTGYPIVDAGMRQLNETGFMHNRVRMIVASFLTKDLLIDWRWGETYFASKLLDYELASNNGGWQWAAGSGCDAAPYFRIFNPYLQTKKFDKDLSYVKKWAPDFEEFNYPKPIVDHEFARTRCLAVYKAALDQVS